MWSHIKASDNYYLSNLLSWVFELLSDHCPNYLYASYFPDMTGLGPCHSVKLNDLETLIWLYPSDQLLISLV